MPIEATRKRIFVNYRQNSREGDIRVYKCIRDVNQLYLFTKRTQWIVTLRNLYGMICTIRKATSIFIFGRFMVITDFLCNEKMVLNLAQTKQGKMASAVISIRQKATRRRQIVAYSNSTEQKLYFCSVVTASIFLQQT